MFNTFHFLFSLEKVFWQCYILVEVWCLNASFIAVVVADTLLRHQMSSSLRCTSVLLNGGIYFEVLAVGGILSK